MLQKLYRYLFWTGYLAVLITAFIPVVGSLSKIKLGFEAFHIRLDHLLHFAAYFLICMYYLVGQKKSLSLFAANPLTKFIVLLLFMAAITELVQICVPKRVFNMFDLVSNVAGVIVGVGIIGTAQWRSGSKDQTAFAKASAVKGR